MSSHKLVQTALATIISAAVGLSASSAAFAEKHNKPQKMQKCYGVAKAGKNDCGTATHGCAGQARTNNDPNEWVFMPKGKCEKMGGSLKPGAAKPAKTSQKNPQSPRQNQKNQAAQEEQANQAG